MCVNLVDKEIVPGSRAKVWNGELTAVRNDGTEFPVLAAKRRLGTDYDTRGEAIRTIMKQLAAVIVRSIGDPEIDSAA
jgi:hypothetical protein